MDCIFKYFTKMDVFNIYFGSSDAWAYLIGVGI
jgi:hypothetical protein